MQIIHLRLLLKEEVLFGSTKLVGKTRDKADDAIGELSSTTGMKMYSPF